MHKYFTYSRAETQEKLLTDAEWVLIAREEKDFGGLTAPDSGWKTLRADGGRVWTDQFSNIFEVLR